MDRSIRTYASNISKNTGQISTKLGVEDTKFRRASQFTLVWFILEYALLKGFAYTYTQARARTHIFHFTYVIRSFDRFY
jgi:hypothetical protein